MQVEILINNDDGTTSKFTEEMAISAIKERDQLRQDLADKTRYNERNVNTIHTIRQSVYDFFNERYDTGNDEITCSVDDVNELLESIGTDKLKKLWTVSGRIEFTVTDIEADSEDDARDQVENNLTVEFDGNIVDDYNIDIHDTEQQ
jgi:hypothetical protein